MEFLQGASCAQLIPPGRFIIMTGTAECQGFNFTLVPTSDLFEMRFHFDSSSFRKIKIPGL